MDIYNALTDSATLGALVSDSIYPDKAVESTPLPAVVYNRISGTRLTSFSGYVGVEYARFQFDVYTELADELRTVGAAILGALSSSVQFKMVADESPADGWSDESQIYRRQFDIMFWHQE